MHLPAGVTYWQKGTFRLYHHNPPLVKLVAALPVVWSGVVTEPLYQSTGLEIEAPGSGDVRSSFRGTERRALLRAVSARPADDAAVFACSGAWSSSRGRGGSTGRGAGCLSLALWVFCPNVLAHARLITTDMGVDRAWASRRRTCSGAIFRNRAGAGPSPRACCWGWPSSPSSACCCSMRSGRSSGLCTSCSSARRREWLARGRRGRGAGDRDRRDLVPDDRCRLSLRGRRDPAGPLRIWLANADDSASHRGWAVPTARTTLFDIAWKFRVNRFRKTWLASVPCPLPEHYVSASTNRRSRPRGYRTAGREAVGADKIARSSARARERPPSRRMPTTWPRILRSAGSPMGKPPKATRST